VNEVSGTRERWDDVDETDVLIAGATPAGLALALDLERRGVRCLVLETGDGRVEAPEVNPIGPRSMELFRRWGVADKIRCAEFPGARPPDIAWVTQVGGHEIHRFERFTHDTHTPEPEQICPVDWLLPVLQTAVGTHPGGAILFRHRLDGFTQDAAGVTARVSRLGEGDTTTIRADYLVSTEGPCSLVRSACGIRSTPRFEPQLLRSIVFRAPRLAEGLAARGHRPALTYFLLQPGGSRFPLQAMDNNGAFKLIAGSEVGAVDAATLVRDAIAFDTPTEVLSDEQSQVPHMVADRYRFGRVFLVGNAAHTLSAPGGFGRNIAIADAADLGWKLAAEYDGWAGAGLLDSYHAERRPVALEGLEAAGIALRARGCADLASRLRDDTADGVLARTELGLQLAESVAHWDVDAPEVHFGHGYTSSLVIGDEVKMTAPWRPSSDPGFRAAHAWLRPGVSTLDVFGDGFVLLCFAPNDRLDAMVRAFEQRGVPLQILKCADPAIAELYRQPYVLVRPDDHVAWRGRQLPADPLLLADMVRGAC